MGLDKPKIVAFVPVRGGSKSIPLKNIKELCGKPLVYWVLNALEQAPHVDEIVLATDSATIKEEVAKFEMSKVIVYDRDPQNAADSSSTESVMLEYINKSELNADDVFMLVQATSPLTSKEDIQAAVDIFNNEKYDSLLSCVRTKRFFWQDNGQALNYDYNNRPRRQDFDGLLMENGAIYINSVSNILEDENRLSGKIGIYEMPEYTAIEIDEPEDWIIIENLMARFKKNT